MKPHGHRTSIIGTPPFVHPGPARIAPRHDRAPSITRDRQREAIAERDRERARRALHLSDERTPIAVIEGLAA